LRRPSSSTSDFIPSSCAGIATPIAATIKFSYEIGNKLPPTVGCSDPVVLFKPDPPSVPGAPHARLLLTVRVDETGRIDNAVFDSYTVEDSTDRSGSIVYTPGRAMSIPANKAWIVNSFTQYELGILENLMKWRLKPAICDGKAVPKITTVSFNFGYDQTHPLPAPALTIPK
jgi:hypothetical protein